jgi:hypothetical protein
MATDADARPPEDPPREAGAEQRYGPLAIARVHKDDGRALILYGHAEVQSEGASEPQSEGASEPSHGHERA